MEDPWPPSLTLRAGVAGWISGGDCQMRILSLAIVLAAFSVSAASAQEGIQFLQVPALKDRIAAWPHDAAGRPYFGAAKVDCFLKEDGAKEDDTLTGCTVAEEEPSGHSIGEAALKLASQYRARATDRAQKLPDGRVRIELTLRFDTPASLIKGATPEQIRAAYPKEADGKDGKARISCATDPSLALKNCVIVSEEPANAGFGKAALGLVSAYTMHPATANGTPVSTRVQFPISFTQSVITNPDWLRKPTIQELAGAWPAAASQKRIEDAKVMLKCVVTVQGLLDKCSVESEDHPGLGFGSAALTLTPLMLMKPRTVDGTPVGGASVDIPIAFRNPGASQSIRGVVKGPDSYQLSRGTWLKAPSSATVAEHFPGSAKVKATTGHVVLNCRFSATGNLRDCNVLQEAPQYLGFGKEALALSKEFQADITAFKDKLGYVYLNLPIHFLDPSSPEWANRTVAQPLWVTGPTTEDLDAAYPPKAKAAGIFSGTGRINCQIVLSGKLGDCRVVSENPSAMDFGPAALKLSQTLAMSPWTVEGLPSDGPRIVVPIQMKIDPPPAPSATN